MKWYFRLILFASLCVALHISVACSKGVDTSVHIGASATGIYPNLFNELLGQDSSAIQAKINAAWQQLFYGDNNSQRVYYPVDPDMAYIHDIGSGDVRSEGISYGMMIAVQLDKKTEFDRLWTWAKTFMQHQGGKRDRYFAWQLTTSGNIMDPNSAADGEEWFVTALIFASTRWGNGDGIFNYQAEAQAILDAMLSKAETSEDDAIISNMFNKTQQMVVFVPRGHADDLTDPSYHLPHFYEIWATWSKTHNDFWASCAATSRQYFKKAVHPVTGLAPDYSDFDGRPIDPWNNGHADFRFDAFRVAMNIAVDFTWYGKDNWAIEQSNRLLNFFYAEGLDSYVNQYSLDGKRLTIDRSPGLVAANAVAALAATNAHRKDFVKALWDMPIPAGAWRYYDGMLYMLALLQTSGNFRMYLPMGK
jgi:oligosaccharide reducing-end xylanase